MADEDCKLENTSIVKMGKGESRQHDETKVMHLPPIQGTRDPNPR